MPDQVEDEQLLSEVLLGERGAADKLYVRLDPIIKAIVRRFTLADTEDAVQDIYARLCADDWRALRLWAKDGPLPAYIATVARNICKDILRRRRPETTFGDDPPEIQDDNPTADPEATAIARQLHECIERAINALSDTYREIIRLRHKEELKHAEIAQRLGKAIGYVGPTLMRAERYLRDEIRERCGDHLGRFEPVVQ